MLVLDRKPGQTIVIGDDIIVSVVEIRGDRVKLGIAAPKDVSIHRKEIYDLVQKEGEKRVKQSFDVE